MIKLSVFTAAAAAAACTLAASPLYAAPTTDLTGGAPFYYVAATTNDNGTPGDESDDFLNPDEAVARTTDSGIPHLPAYHGNSSTNNTHRFYNINEQVFTMVGDGKHGLWRTHDNGTVREYLTKDAKDNNRGLAITEDPNSSTSFDEASEWADYTHIDPLDGGFAHYFDVSPNDATNGDGNHGWVDLPISHAKYEGKYDTHVPIDLPSWYCTMSGPEYAKAQAAMRFAWAQDAANEVGPLGQRAGMDVTENNLNVLRVDLFPDARVWVNTLGEDDLDWDAIDAKKTPFEIYLIERPFFGEEYIFLSVIFGDKSNKSKNFSYIRPDGAYYDSLMARKASGEKLAKFRTKLRHQPKFGVLKDNGKASGKRRAAVTTNIYGVHHPDTGHCPSVGGDFGAAYYGGSWPNTYQEVTPLCDAVLVDIKLFANLNGVAWSDAGNNLANATIAGNQNTGDNDGDANALTREHSDLGGNGAAYNANIPAFGVFADPYLASTVNPEARTATGTQIKTYQTSQDTPTVNAALPFVPST